MCAIALAPPKLSQTTTPERGDSAKVQAIKMLLALQDGEPAATANSDKFANLDEWRRLRDVEPRRGGPQGA